MNFNDCLRDNETVFGTFAKTSDPLLIQALGLAGFNFVILDNEHGPNSTRDLLPLILAAENAGLYPIVRVSRLDALEIQRTLDLGVAGIQVPQVNTREDAMNVVRYSKFHPLGARGMCTFVRPGGFSLKDKHDYFREQNQLTTVIHIEGLEGLNNLESILEVDGIDVIFIGPNDLSQSMGIPGQVDHPDLVSAIGGLVDQCRQRNKHIGIFADTLEKARQYREMGIKYIGYSVDVGIFARACSEITSGLRSGHAWSREAEVPAFVQS